MTIGTKVVGTCREDAGSTEPAPVGLYDVKGGVRSGRRSDRKTTESGNGSSKAPDTWGKAAGHPASSPDSNGNVRLCVAIAHFKALRNETPRETMGNVDHTA